MRAANISVLRAGFWALSSIELRSPSAMVVTLKAAYWSLFEADTFRCCLFLLVWTSTSSTSPSASAPRRSAVRRSAPPRSTSLLSAAICAGSGNGQPADKASLTDTSGPRF